MSTPDDAIKRQLPRTWPLFFSRFGKLLDIQRLSIPFVLSGRNLVVCSPTASGKTEAVLAPLVEQLLARDQEGLNILWISPTRALVNDLAIRFADPLRTLRISFARKTADRPEFHPRKPASILVTTPESFDSLLTRHPQTLFPLQAIVLDDIHLLDGTYRGDQIRVLLERLRRLLKREVQRYALSATIENAESLGRRYMSDFDVVSTAAAKRLEYELLPADGSLVDSLLADFRRHTIHKAIVFVNSRAEAERMVHRFHRPPFLHRTFVHHGSLSKREREEIERFMNTSATGLCIATTTLELGIDIGDIDAVVLFGPPPDVRSLLQRVGRGNRRRQDFALAYGLYADSWERLLFESLFHDAREGRLEADLYSPHLSVAVQQALSYLYQRRNVGLTPGALTSILRSIHPADEIPDLLHHLETKGYAVSIKDNLFVPSSRLLHLARRGLIHSNIDRLPSDYAVVHAESGRPLGSIQFAAPVFQLGGKTWETVRRRGDTVWVRPVSGSGIGSQRAFKGKNIHWDFRLGMSIKSRLFPGLGPLEYPFFKERHTLYLFHFTGPVYGLLWQTALQSEKIPADDIEGKYLIIQGLAGLDHALPAKGDLFQAAIDKSGFLRRILPLGAYFYLLSREEQLQAIGLSLKLDAFHAHLARVSFRSITAAECASALSTVGSGETEEAP